MAGGKLLLHVCCAPDATVPWPELSGEGFCVSAYLFGGNIHPEEEYQKRAASLARLAEALCGDFVVSAFEPLQWLKSVGGLSNEPEGGARCRVCFTLQLEASAKYAADNGFSHLSTTLTISPHKDPRLINIIGSEISEKYGLSWVERIWRRRGGFKRSVEESRRLGLYRQNYCGCVYSERDAYNGLRKDNDG